MTAALAHPTFRRLYGAQISSLVGTGLMTVALAILALEIGGADAGLILGAVFTLKMIAYVGFAPVASALTERIPVRHLLVGLDAGRLCLTGLMPFVTSTWQIFALVFVFQLCSAAFTPAFQSAIPEILTDKKDYASGLSLSRIAYNLETMLSPFLAGLLLMAMQSTQLFWAASLCFAASGLIVLSTALPRRARGSTDDKFVKRLFKGINIYWRTPRLRGLLAINFALSLSIAWILVNTVVYAGVTLGAGAAGYTQLMTAYGVGSILAALATPRFVAHFGERGVMLAGGFAIGLLPWAIMFSLPYTAALLLWLGVGAAAALVMTPGGLVLARSADSPNRPALYAAQFSLSHAGWLIAYPLAGWLGSALTPETAFVCLAAGTLTMTAVAMVLWPTHDPHVRRHTHFELEHSHSQVRDDHHSGEHAQFDGPRRHRHVAFTHEHAFHIDDHHPVWAMPGADDGRGTINNTMSGPTP